MCFVVGEMSDSPAVELRQVSKVFPGGVKAVDDVTLQIPVGGIIALLGPSGGGKTTTLRLINRLEDATTGEVLVRGQDVRGQRPERSAAPSAMWSRRAVSFRTWTCRRTWRPYRGCSAGRGRGSAGGWRKSWK